MTDCAESRGLLNPKTWLQYRVYPAEHDSRSWDQAFLLSAYRPLVVDLKRRGAVDRHWFSRRGDFTRLRLHPPCRREDVRVCLEDALDRAKALALVGHWDSSEGGHPWDAGPHSGGPTAVLPWLLFMESLSEASLEMMALHAEGRLSQGWDLERLSHHWAHFVFNQFGLAQTVYAKCGCQSGRGLTSLCLSSCPDCGEAPGIDTQPAEPSRGAKPPELGY